MTKKIAEKIVACQDCETLVEYKTHRPKRCTDCAEIAKNIQDRIWERENPRGSERVLQRKITATEKIDAIKLESGCVDCGYNTHPAALDFDHLPGCEKVRNISAMRHYAWDTILAEIEKCEVVCSNCHRIRTFNRLLEEVANAH